MFPNENQPSQQPQTFQPQQPQQQPMQQQPQMQQPQDNQPQQPTQPNAFETYQPQYQPAQQQEQQPQQQQTTQPQQQLGQLQSDFEVAQQQQYQQPQQPNQQYGQSQFETQSIEESLQQPQQQQMQPEVQQPQYPQQPTQPQYPQAQEQQQETVQDISRMEQELEAYLDQQFPMPELPDLSQVDGDDPKALQQFFVDLDAAQQQRWQSTQDRKEFKAKTDEYLWSEVAQKYPQLSKAPSVESQMRQMYAGARAMGQNVTPLQIVDNYARSMGQQYQRGYNSQQVQTQVRQSQPLPNGGQQQAPQQPTVSAQDYDKLNRSSNDVIDDAAAIVAKMRAAGQGGFN